MELFAIKDVKAGTFGNIVCYLNRAVALRGLAEAVQQPDNMLSKHGFDFQLYHLGTFDQTSGVVECFPQPDFVITVGDLAPPVQQQRTA